MNNASTPDIQTESQDFMTSLFGNPLGIIGREVVFGINNWSEFLTEMEPPHHKIGHGGFTGVIGKVPDDASMKQAAEKALNDAGNKKFERFRG